MGMGQHSCCNKQKVKRGLWSPEEDEKLINYISTYGHGCWSSVPRLAGLQRCGKSCRLRWINYLRPDLKRGCFSSEEATLIVKLHRILGNRWSQIAKQLPGRTDNEVKNFWNSSIKKKLFSEHGLISDHHHHQRHHHHRPGAINASFSSSSIANNANHIVINGENQGLYATNPTNNYSDINNHLMIFPSDLLRHEDDNIHQLYVNSTHLMITAPTPPFAAVPPATINLQPSDQFVHHDQSNFDLHDHYVYNLNHPVPILPPVPAINSGQQYYSVNRYEHHPWLQANYGGSNSLLSPAGIVDDHDQFMSTVVPSNAMMSSSRAIEEPNMIRDGVHGASRDTPPPDQMSQFIEAILHSSMTKVPSSLVTSNMSSSSSSSLSPLSCTSTGQFLVHNINAGCTTLPSTSWEWDP